MIKKLLTPLILIAPICSFSQPTKNCVEYIQPQRHVHVVRANLECSNLKILGTPEEEKGIETSQFASKENTQVAINGDYFNPNFQPLGLNITNGVRWSKSNDKSDRSFFACNKNNQCVIDPKDHLTKEIGDWDTVVGGWQTFENGYFSCASSASPGCTDSNANKRHPRTIIGLDESGKNLFLIVIEGRLPDFQGVALNEASDILRKLRINIGLNLDGGGSSTMIINGKRVSQLPVNQPSERPVANHLGIKIQ